MRRRACGAAVAALAALAVAAPATYAAGQPLNAYRVKADPETLEALAANKLRVVPGGLSKVANVMSTYLPRRITAPLMGKAYARMADE